MIINPLQSSFQVGYATARLNASDLYLVVLEKEYRKAAIQLQ